MRTALSLLSAVVFLTSTVAQLPNYVPTNGLIGWWPFDGNADDASGNGYNGTVNGAILDLDRNGNANSAYAFSGASLIPVDNTLPSLDPSVDPGITISFWVKSTSLSPTNTDLFDLRSSDNSSVQVLLNNEGTANVQYNSFDGPGGGGAGGCYASEPYVLDEWFHVVVTENYATDTSRMYVDNLLACETSFQYPPMTDPHLNFGSRWDFQSVTCCNMIGSLDEFGVWYRVLTTGEITGLFNASGGPCVSSTSVSLSGLSASYSTIDPPVTLSAAPTGGVFIGPGVTGDTFDPAAAGEGTHSVMYIYEDEQGCVNAAALCTTVDLGARIAESSDLTGVRVYPNPNHGQFSVEMELNGLISMQVFDARGRMVVSEVFQAHGVKTARILDLSSEAKGTYSLQVQNNGGTVTQTVVVE